MESHRFDHIAKRLADTRCSRRVPLFGGVGFAAAIISIGFPGKRDGFAEPVLGAEATLAAESAPSGEVNIEGMWLCDQLYVLCSMAPCEPSLADKNSSLCSCTVEDGYSIGYTTCGERAPTGQKLISTFSMANVTSGVLSMVCTEKNLWANCLDMPCEIDPDDPTRATCQCPVQESGNFVTVGGDCDFSTCSSVIWSAASVAGNIRPIFEAAMKQVNQAVSIPETCPTATPASTPAS